MRAALAEQAGDPESLIVASLLHDLGHLVMSEDGTTDMRHQEVGADLLGVGFGPAVIRAGAPARGGQTLPVRHRSGLPGNVVASPRCTASPLQGGPYDVAQAEAFVAHPHGPDAVRLRATTILPRSWALRRRRWSTTCRWCRAASGAFLNYRPMNA
ncbi:hypothetical protein ACU4GD_08230 [Cupriavidus basilensis]